MPSRSILALALLLPLSATATAHFVFIVPQGNDKVRVIFSDSLEPDENVAITKIAATKLLLRGTDGKSASVSMTKGDHAYEIKVPGTGSRIVYGTTNYGVIQKGKSKPFLLRYFPKAIIGAIPADGGKVGMSMLLEIVPIVKTGKVAFEVFANNKPVAKAEVTVILAGGKTKKLETNDKGRTEVIETTGKCGAWVRNTVSTAGKLDGKAYEEARYYATLVIDVPGK